MTDRELLELAAKAADISHECIYFPDKGFRLGERGNGYTSWIEWWNPLTEDGDALRLAVTLKLFPVMMVMGKFVGFDDMDITEEFSPDPYAATRRAIVRAAAEIGRNM